MNVLTFRVQVELMAGILGLGWKALGCGATFGVERW